MKRHKDDHLQAVEARNLLLETRVKHLSNDLRLTREENETATRSYFEIYSNMEKKVEERTRALEALQKELREKNQELQIMLDSSPAMIFYKDAGQRYIRVNRRFCEILGVPIDEILGKSDAQLFSENGFVQRNDLTVLRTGQAILNRSEVIETPNGRKDILIDRIPDKDSDGNVRGIISFALDVTESKRTAAEKKRLEAQFEQAQRLEAIGTLAGGIAHNFNNLLMGIQGNAAVMLMDTAPTHPHFDKLRTVEKLVQSGAKLTTQLLGYAREGRYEVRPISLNHMVRETAETFGSTKREITIHQDLSEDLCAMEADPGQIEQALLNLCVNAAEAMPQGGDLFLKTGNVTHEDLAHKPYKAKPGKYVCLSFRDTGIGMDRKTMEHVFEPFFTSRGLGKGTGLGLASVYGIVKAHGGYIDVHSDIGHGTTFEIFFPAIEKEPLKETSPGQGFLKGTETVLLLDDEDIVLNVGNEMLRKLGYKVLAARSGREALETFHTRQDEIDLVILDMVMPDMNGGDVYDRIKKIKPEVKVLLSSGYSLEGQAAEILERGCDGFIQKPFNLSVLSERLREILEARKACRAMG
jgi:PAS domain S-box-containing protein